MVSEHAWSVTMSERRVVSQHHSCHQARNQLRTPGGRRVFWEWPKFFKLCPILSNYVQHIFPGGAKIF